MASRKGTWNTLHFARHPRARGDDGSETRFFAEASAVTEKPFSPSCERNREPILAVLCERFADRRHVLEIGSGTGQHAVHFAQAMPWLVWQCSDRAEYLPGIGAWLDEAGLANTPAAVELDVAVTPWLLPHLPFAPQGDFLRGAGEGWGERARKPVSDESSAIARPHPPCGHLLPHAGEGNTRFDAAFSANTLHIMGWAEVEALFVGLDRVLAGPSTSPPRGDAQDEREHGSGVLVVYGPFNYAGAYTSDSNREFDGWLRARDPRSGIRDFEAVNALAQAIGLRLLDDVAMPANNRCLVWRRG
jgi:hypothetical protein